MKSVKLIYNPLSGDATFKHKLDFIIEKFQKSGYLVSPYRISSGVSLDSAFLDLDRGYDMICASGGDGTINSVVNAMISNNIDLPLGIFPFGTSNDFASYLGIPKDIGQCCKIVLGKKLANIDVGRVNDRYFINVCSAGLLTDVAYKTDTNMKNALGKIAYYLRGIEEVPKFSPIKMRMQYGDSIIEDNFLLLLVLNGSSAGGFTKLAPYAKMDDGYMDIIAIKSANISNMFGLFLKIIRGEHVGDPNLYHFQADSIKITCTEGFETDIDGERGPDFPLDIEVIKHGIKVFVPKLI